MEDNFFDRLNLWIRETEGSIVNFLSAFAPWLTPIIPAYMTFQHAQNTLGFPLWIAATSALVVEILGFSSVSTLLAFWFYNRRNSAESKKAPIFLVVIAFSFYLSLVVFSNVLLDSFPGSAWAENAVRAFFTLQTIPAALLVSVRTQHRALLKEIAREKEEKEKYKEQDGRTSRSARPVPELIQKHSKMGRPSIHQSKVFSYLDEHYSKTGEVASFSEIMDALNLPQSTVSRLRNTWIQSKQGE